MEVADVRAHLHQQFLGFFIVLRVLTVVRQAQVVEGNWQQLRTVIQHCYATTLELADVFGLEDQVPGIHRRIVAQHGFDLVDVVTDAGTAPQIREAILVARIVDLQRLEQHRIEVLPVGQLTLVEFFQHLALDLPGHEVVGRKHHVIAGVAGHQLAVEGFVAVEHVVGRHDTAGLLEVLQGVGGDVAGPVVDFYRVGGLGNGASQQQWGDEQWAHVWIPCFVCFYRRRQAIK
ncbi:hypothetical protein UB47_11120 [Pseudomonas sp. 5]|nr:hypothetical protein UB47_11120 [Pseudomonas sp. 5]